MARQHPFDMDMASQFLNGSDLLSPGIPAVIPVGSQCVVMSRPREMISGKKVFLLPEQHAVASGVARCVDETGLAQNGIIRAIQDDFGIRLRRTVRLMDDPPCAKRLGIAVRIGDIIPMS